MTKESTQWRTRHQSGRCDIDKYREDLADVLSRSINESDPNLENAFTPAVARGIIAECKEEQEYRRVLTGRITSVIREYAGRKAAGYA